MKDKDKFLSVYSNLSIDVRKEIIAIVDEKPITWDVAFQEIEKETKMGEKILRKIVELGLV